LISVDDIKFVRDKWITVTKVWRVLWFQYLVGVQEFRKDKGAREEQGIVISSMKKEKKIINWEQDFLYTTE
jgi:Cys-tRNA synthase (O-phospho-L-seryl-tRNA:Cys-tRNA synthase)